MRILFEALDKKKGMTLDELIVSFEKSKALSGKPEQVVKVQINLSGTIKAFEIEA